MARKFIRRFLPHPDRIRQNRSLRWLGPTIHDPNLWRLNRRSVAGAVAVGAFFAFILPFAQFLAAGITAVSLRVNLPVAVTSTLITNPLTFGPWYYLAYKIGALITGAPVPSQVPAAAQQATGGWWDGVMSGLDQVLAMGTPLLVGLALLAVVSAAAGYFLVHLLWRIPAYLRLRRLRRKGVRLA